MEVHLKATCKQKNCEGETRDNSPLSKEITVNSFDEGSAREFRAQVLAQAAMGGPELPIVVYIDSYGGYADSLASMLETMDEVPNAFITVAIGKAVSCGAILLSHGDYRFCGRYARVMIHEVKSGSYGSVDDMKNEAKETERLNLVFMELLAKNCGLASFKELKEKLRAHDGNDIWMGPQEALDFGIADFVGMPKLAPIVQYQCGVMPPKPPRRILTQEVKDVMVGKEPTGSAVADMMAEVQKAMDKAKKPKKKVKKKITKK
jgi:ATP-dependent Clp protease protease subunit